MKSVLASCLLLSVAVPLKAQTYQFVPMAPSSIEANAAADNGVYGDGTVQDWDGDTANANLTQGGVDAVAVPYEAEADGYGDAWATAKFFGKYGEQNGWLYSQGESVLTLAGGVESGAPAGTYAYGTVSSEGKIDCQAWALGPGKYNGKLLFDAGFGSQPLWSYYTGPTMKASVQGSNVTWAFNTTDGKWHASGILYEAAIVNGQRVHKVKKYINDSTEPPISGFPSFLPKTYDCSGWVTTTQVINYGHEVESGVNYSATYGSSMSKVLLLEAEARVQNSITN